MSAPLRQEPQAAPHLPRDPARLVQAHAARLALPAHIGRLNRMIDDPSHSASDIARELERTPAVAERLLRIVAAGGFAAPGEPGSIAEAMVRLGPRQLRDLSLAAAAVHCLPADSPELHALWRHGLATALLAQAIARDLAVRRRERHFLIGLFRDLGLTALWHLVPERASDVLAAPPARRADAARAQLGFAPAELGSALLRRWGLPESVTAAVACLGEPENADCYRPETAVARLASAVATRLAEPPCGAPVLRPDDNLGLSPARLDELASEVQGRLARLGTALGLSPA